MLGYQAHSLPTSNAESTSSIMKDFNGPISFSSATKAPCNLEMRLRNNNHLFTFSTLCARFWEPGILVCVTGRTETPNIFANSRENSFRLNLTQP